MVSHDDGTRSRCPRMTRFEVLDDDVWTPRCDSHRRVDPGTKVRAIGIEHTRR
jgi:rubredoxin